MKNCVLFLIVLIAPLAFCSTETLSLIDQTAEGKELLDTLFLQSKLEGSDLSVARLLAAINSSEDLTETKRKIWEEAQEQHNARCKDQNAALNKAWVDLQDKQRDVGRNLHAVQDYVNTERSRKESLNRELENYNLLCSMIEQNNKEWEEFIRVAKETYDNIISIVDQMQAKVLELSTTEASQGAFIQMDRSYFSELAQIKADFDNLDKGAYEAISPAVTNLLMIMSKSKNIADPKVRLAISECFHELKESIKEIKNVIESEHATESTLNQGLKELFESNRERTRMIIESTDEILKHLNEKEAVTQKMFDQANNFVAASRQILNRCIRICQNWAQVHADALVRISKLQNYIIQVREIVNERFPKLTSFFIQRSLANSQ